MDECKEGKSAMTFGKWGREVGRVPNKTGTCKALPLHNPHHCAYKFGNNKRGWRLLSTQFQEIKRKLINIKKSHPNHETSKPCIAKTTVNKIFDVIQLLHSNFKIYIYIYLPIYLTTLEWRRLCFIAFANQMKQFPIQSNIQNFTWSLK